MSSLLIKHGQLVTDDRGDILIEDGIIKEIGEGLSGEEAMDATGLLIFPGLIDCHVHFREPGYEEAEDMESGAHSAIAGGITTVCEMPNTNPPTSTFEALANKRKRAQQITNCDIRFFFGVTKKEHLAELEKINREDICGVKLYLGHSTGNQKVEEGIEADVFALCAKRGIPVVCHCEDQQTIQENLTHIEGKSIHAHSAIRSVEAAVKATSHALDLAKEHGAHVHIAHLSTKEELHLIQDAKQSGQPVTCEVAPHHLFLSTDDYDALGTLAKMNPPLRTKDHCEALFAGVLSGDIDCIATDHAPHTRMAKNADDPLQAPSGVPGVETMVPLLLTKGMTPTLLLHACFTRPNEIFSLGKAGITAGKPADLCLIDPQVSWTIRGKELHSKCGWTPYEGWEVRGKVVNIIKDSRILLPHVRSQ